jgi:hypothetical protein
MANNAENVGITSLIQKLIEILSVWKRIFRFYNLEKRLETAGLK